MEKNEIISNVADINPALVLSKAWTRSYMDMAIVRVSPSIFPPTMRTTPNSPSVCAKVRMNDVNGSDEDKILALLRREILVDHTPKVRKISMALLAYYQGG